MASDATESIVSAGLRLPYPYYGDANASGAYVIPEEVATFAYDSASGTLMDANNAHAKIHRTVYPNGQLREETTRLRAWLGDTTDASYTHTATLGISYDRDGRRTVVQYPSLLSPGAAPASAYFAYDSITGALSGVTDLQGHVTQYQYDFRNAPVTTVLPASSGTISDRRSFDDDGALTHWEAGSGATGVDLRNEDHAYDFRGKDTLYTDRQLQTREWNVYDGLGRLARNAAYDDLSVAVGGDPAVRQTFYTTDGVGNVTLQTGTEAVFLNGGGNSSGATTTRKYDPVSGRLILSYEQHVTGDTVTTSSSNQPYITRYDLSGNVTWSGRFKFDQAQVQSEQRSYYAADNTLRATDVRYWISGGAEHGAFEEYAYDALGRRVGVRTRQFCSSMTEANVPRIDCAVSTMRRTLWDGSAELGEIQVPGDNGVDLEPDSVSLDSWGPPSALNLEPFFGRVAYVYAGTLDQPLAITRMGYQTLANIGGTVQSVAVPAFTIYPLWNSHGVADRVSHLGAETPCNPQTSADYPSSTDPGAIPMRSCVRYDLANNIWLPYYRATAPNGAWHGSLLEDKRDASGLMYRRNRYYDPTSGRFTQEDPIGVAGGLNVYGFADGDPVTYSDPFGLCPPEKVCPDEVRKLVDFHTNVVLPVTLGALAFGALENTSRMGVGSASSEAKSQVASRSVVHFTSKEGAAAIEASGGLRAGSFVALPEEVAGMSAATVERFLEIGPGKGAMRATFKVPADALKTPFNGPATSGGATQFQLKKIIPVSSGTFMPTP